MARVFICHSSIDKGVARQLANDLSLLGHEPWLDEYAIKVGESIPEKIEQGLRDADFVAVLLTPDAVRSGWVDREWKAKYWAEVQSGRVMVLPALVTDCEIPVLLGPKKYADFRNYATGLVQLVGAIDPVAPPMAGASASLQRAPGGEEVAQLIATVQSHETPLSQCFAEALQLALKLNDRPLAEWCGHELRGWRGKVGAPDEPPTYRKIEMFVSPHQVNMNYMRFGGSASAALSYMQRDPDFVPRSMLISESIGQLEARPKPSDPDKGLLSVEFPWSSIQENAPMPDAVLHAYAPGDAYVRLLGRIRTELTARLLNMLPPMNQPKGAD